jgi:outer membrane receptor protein involved in Fe transport
MLHAIGVAVALAVGPAEATTTRNAAPDAIPEMVVTARRTEEPLADLPLAVTAFDAAAIERLQARSLDDLARFTPGFSFNSAAGRGPNSNRPAMRGLTTIRNGIANSTAAATFVDGVYLGGSIQSARLFDLERVEILRGPQSAQFGRATYAGAVNYVTRRATEAFAAGASGTVAGHDDTRASGWVSGPVLDGRLRLFAGAGLDRYGGEYPNTRGGTAGGEESRQATLKLEATPLEGLDVVLRAGLQRTDDDHFAMWLQPRTANNCCFRTPEAPRAREYYVGTALASDTVTLWTDALEAAGGAGFELDRALGSLALRWAAPGGWELTSLTGAVDDELERGFDASYAAYDPVPAQPGSFLQRDRLEQDDFSHELRVASPRDRALRWQAGAYAYRGSLDEVAEERVLVAADGSVTVLPNFGDLTLNDVENRALFGALEVDLPRAVTAGVELRYAADEVAVASLPNAGGTGPALRFADTFYSLSPRFTLAWQATPAFMPYLNVARGQSPGTFNPAVPPLPDGSPDERYRSVDEEVVWSYEAGLRGTAGDGRARFALAAYHMDVRDQQFTTIVELEDGRTASLLANVGRTAVDGVELEVDARLSDAVTAGFTYAWTDSEIREQLSEEQADLRGSDGSPEDIARLGSVAGHHTPRIPAHMASLAVEYRAPAGAGREWFAGGDWSYESSRYAQEDNLIETGARALLGVHAGIAGERTGLRLWVTNLTDDDTPVDVQRYIDRRFGTLPLYPQEGARPSTTPRGFGVSLPRGRQAGATLTWRF